MIKWLLATIGTAALGSVVPVINIELYLIGVLSTMHGLSWWVLGLGAAVGQLAGKTLFYLAGKGSFRLGKRLSRMTEAKKGSRWRRWLDSFHQRAEKHPWWALGVLFISAITGLPPFTMLCFLSGAAGIAPLAFFCVSLVGRSIHFLLVAGAPELVHHLPSALS